MVTCSRCKQGISTTGQHDTEDSHVNWLGYDYHKLCWEIWLSMWVMTQSNREEALDTVDSILGKGKYAAN